VGFILILKRKFYYFLLFRIPTLATKISISFPNYPPQPRTPIEAPGGDIF